MPHNQRKTGTDPLHVLVMEPYYGGSHRSFADGLVRNSRHHVHLVTMPPRKWKWRMRGAGLYMAGQVRTLEHPVDVIVTSSLLPLADFRALAPPALARLPVLYIMHENQMTYPVQVEDARDYHYGITNILACRTATRVAFNSRYHLETFFEAAERLLKKMPDCPVDWVLGEIRDRSEVMTVPVDFVEDLLPGPAPRWSDPPVIVWNHRWEHDKNPEAFFEALFELDRRGVPFRLVVLGEHFRTHPEVFDRARDRLQGHIDHWGFVDDRHRYHDMLVRADIVVSTSIHEFFGISVVEAMHAGCVPLLPDRLTYPELLGPDYRAFLYKDSELVDRLQQLLLADGPPPGVAGLAQRMDGFSWTRRRDSVDKLIERTALHEAQS